MYDTCNNFPTSERPRAHCDRGERGRVDQVIQTMACTHCKVMVDRVPSYILTRAPLTCPFPAGELDGGACRQSPCSEAPIT